MSTRQSTADEATRRGRRQLAAVADELRNARRAAGLSQAAIANGLGCSRQQIAAVERARHTDVGVVQLVRIGALVGLDVSLRTFPGGSPLRDAAQLRLLARFRAAIGPSASWETEVAVSNDPRERRAFDAVLTMASGRVGIEAISRLTDAQAQIRAITLKQEAARIRCVVLVLADTRHNWRAIRDAAPTLGPAFPIHPRLVLRSLRVGELPPANGFVVV